MVNESDDFDVKKSVFEYQMCLQANKHLREQLSK